MCYYMLLHKKGEIFYIVSLFSFFLFKKVAEDDHFSPSESLLDWIYPDSVCKHDRDKLPVMNQRHFSLNPTQFLLIQEQLGPLHLLNILHNLFSRNHVPKPAQLAAVYVL